MYKTVEDRKYWVNEISEKGGRFRESYSPRFTASLNTLLIAALTTWSVVDMRPEMPWWVSIVIFLGCAVIIMPVALFAVRRLSKIGEFEREGVIARVDGHAYKSLAAHLEDCEVYLEQITEDQDRRVIWRLVSAYLLSVHEFAVSLERGVATNEHSTEIRRFVGASAAKTAGLISERLKLLAQGDDFVRTCNEQARNLRAKLADGPMSGELRASILAAAAREEFE